MLQAEEFKSVLRQISKIVVMSGHPLLFSRRWTDQAKLLFTTRGLQSCRHKHPLKRCFQWATWPHVKSSPVSTAFLWVLTQTCPTHLCQALTHLMWLFFNRGLWWCFVSVYRHAADVPGEGASVTRHQHTSWWESVKPICIRSKTTKKLNKWIRKWINLETTKKHVFMPTLNDYWKTDISFLN